MFVRSVTLTPMFLGKFTITKSSLFCHQQTTSLLEAAEDKEWRYNFFNTKSSRKQVPEMGVNLGVTSQVASPLTPATTPGKQKILRDLKLHQ